MTRWEYKLITAPSFDELTEAGKDGWELVAVHPETDQYYGAAYLKRPLPAEPICCPPTEEQGA